MSSQNAIMGDLTLDLPRAAIEEETLVEERKMAKYSKSKEFKRIVAYVEERIAFYQNYLPNGMEVGSGQEVTAEDWRVANRVIMELKVLIGQYETASEAVKEANAVSTSR